jgi:DNA-binding MarR family transcriptional regulator
MARAGERATEEAGVAAMRAWHGLLGVQGALVRDLEARLEAAEGLSLWDLKALRALAAADDECRRMTDLARAIGYTPSGLTRLVERLERAGLIARSPCSADGRSMIASLTAEGRVRMRHAERTHRRHVRERFQERFTEQEMAQLTTLLERLLPGEAALS